MIGLYSSIPYFNSISGAIKSEDMTRFVFFKVNFNSISGAIKSMFQTYTSKGDISISIP